jgi:hypothetical protein
VEKWTTQNTVNAIIGQLMSFRVNDDAAARFRAAVSGQPHAKLLALYHALADVTTTGDEADRISPDKYDIRDAAEKTGHDNWLAEQLRAGLPLELLLEFGRGIAGPAIVSRDGTLYTADDVHWEFEFAATHADILHHYFPDVNTALTDDELIAQHGLTKGFLTDDRRFLNRADAMQYARQAKQQLKRVGSTRLGDETELDSHHLLTTKY